MAPMYVCHHNSPPFIPQSVCDQSQYFNLQVSESLERIHDILPLPSSNDTDHREGELHHQSSETVRAGATVNACL